MTKESCGVVGSLRGLVDMDIPGQVVADSDAQVFCLICVAQGLVMYGVRSVDGVPFICDADDFAFIRVEVHEPI